MFSGQAYRLNEDNLLSEEELRSLLTNSEQLYKRKQDPPYPQELPNISREVTDKLRSLSLLKQEYETLQEESRQCEEMLGEATSESEYNSLQEDLSKVRLAGEVVRTKVISTIASENSSRDSCLVEIRPGVGGIEAGLFTRDLFQMYYKFAEVKKWKVEVLENRADALGNLSFIGFLVKGRAAFSYLKNEAGIHRVQRVPLTENKGRIQTSTTSVVVLPEVSKVTVKLETHDLRIDTYRSSGAGGQHVNTTNSAIRVTHLPTGISTVSQDGRSQHDNKEKALLILRSRLFEKYKAEQEGKLGLVRSSAIGNSERAEKIRTYNYPQNRVTDHRISLSMNRLSSVMGGDLEEFCQQLSVFETRNKVVSFTKMVGEQANE